MSDLQKAWAKNRLSALPAESFDEREEEETGHVPELPEHFDDDSSSASSASSTGTVIPSPSQNLFARPQGAPRGRSLQQIPWTTYFERELFLHDQSSPTNPTIHAYLTSPVGKGPLFVMHHGAGSSGLSFAVVGHEIRKRLPSAGILSLDARGHGSTTTPDSQTVDLSLETLASDFLSVILLARKEMKWPELPPIILVGHSLGGAVVTEVAKTGKLGNAVLGYVVLDVVEGSAIDALQSMHTYLSTRPAGFPTLESGIDWHIRTRTIRNSLSARTSVPALLMLQKSPGDSRPWKWRTDLGATQPFWENWFVGLSKKFLGAKGGKLLLLAGTDRLDTELTIGQMQGKYSLQIFPEAGHFIHEDLPEKTAISLVDFHKRNDRSALVLPPKVSDLLKQGKKV
ncbi:protein phosphatase methylesterase [Annulohypoxylon maeteangense]|uniref:protein phosphatase methylesterase n=1 Tax=Annulohypoxylon maeteangense TaxID=1927788 RepID=UPI00200789A3|nr:protein phosphatase methylesterase [Annulohypoxylon maeteangense]KAI0880402.1 protein phosphatase methylesterase [Annulohypoxylon maeteangense]